MTPAYEAAESGAAQPCCAYATSVPSGDAANSLTASPVTGLAHRPQAGDVPGTRHVELVEARLGRSRRWARRDRRGRDGEGAVISGDRDAPPQGPASGQRGHGPGDLAIARPADLRCLSAGPHAHDGHVERRRRRSRRRIGRYPGQGGDAGPGAGRGLSRARPRSRDRPRVTGQGHGGQDDRGDAGRDADGNQPGAQAAHPAPDRSRSRRRGPSGYRGAERVGLIRGHDRGRGGERVGQPVRGRGHLFRRNHRVPLNARARAASPRAAVDLTVPALMPSVAAISASDRPT